MRVPWILRRNAGLDNEADVKLVLEENMVRKPEDPSDADGDSLTHIAGAKNKIYMRILWRLLLPILRDTRTALISLLVAAFWTTLVVQGSQVPSVSPPDLRPVTRLA